LLPPRRDADPPGLARSPGLGEIDARAPHWRHGNRGPLPDPCAHLSLGGRAALASEAPGRTRGRRRAVRGSTTVGRRTRAGAGRTVPPTARSARGELDRG